MKKTFFPLFLLFLSTSFVQNVTGQNLLINGDFESGGSGTGFQTNYFTPGTAGTSNPRDYSVTTDPNTMNNAFYAHCGDHTTGSGHMLVADGSGNSGDKVWELLNGSTIGVVSGRTYIFSYWIRSISASNSAANSAIIGVNTNGTTSAPVLVSGSATCPTGNPSAWVQVSYQWTATTSNAQIWLTDNQTAGGGTGNDFALDDLSLVVYNGPLTIRYNAADPGCFGNTNGSINVAGFGGTPPYSYSLNGGAFQASGYFPVAPSAGNWVTIHDAATPTQDTISSLHNISVNAPVASLTVSNDTSLCVAAPVNLLASGGTNYSWSPSTGLNFNNIPNPIANPGSTQTYTVTTTVTSKNLLSNPGFEKGDSGFYSDYFYYTATTNQNAYGINSNAQSFDASFSACTDHTNPGVGKMMVIDGATVANNKVWCETVAVNPGTTYTFSYYLQTIALPSPAQIETMINNVSMGIATASSTACGWTQYTYTWNSGVSTSANICLYDRNIIATGNDFALDDLSFTTTCTESKTVTITIGSLAAPTVSITQPTCAINTGTITVTAPTTGVTYSFNNGISFQAGTTSGALSPNTYQVVVKNGAGCISTATPATINTQPTTPSAPIVGITQPNCTIPSGSITINSPTGANLVYSNNGVTYQAGTTFTGLTPGNTYPITVKDNASGCISNITNAVINALPANPLAPTASATQQPSCTTPTGTITITAPIGVNYLYSNNGTTFQAGTTFTGLTPGTTYPITVKDNTTGCISSITNITINPLPANPAAPTASATQQPSCTTTTGTITITAPIGVNYLYSNNGTTFQAGTTFTGLTPGTTYPITVKDNTTGCISSITNITINPLPANPAAPTASATQQPSCTTPTGTITITAPIGVNYLYSNNGSVYQVGTSFTGLSAGTTYPITVKNTTTGCVSAITNITINSIPANPPAPTGTATQQPNCTITTGTIVITAPTGANYTYSDDGTTYQAGTSFTGLSGGTTYPITVKDNTTGCVSPITNIVINPVLGAPATPVATATQQPNCITPTGTILVSSPINVNYLYSINGSTYQSGTSFTGLTPGISYPITVKDNSNGCISSITNVVINPLPTNPTTPTAVVSQQPNCTIPTGTISVSAPLGINYLYSNDGINYQSGTVFSSLSPGGTYPITVKNNLTGCISTVNNISINAITANPGTPVAAVTTQPTCNFPTGTITISAPSGINYYYSIDGLNYQSGNVYSGLTPGTAYPITVKDNVTGCISSALNLNINAIPAPPATPTSNITQQPNCILTTGSFQITSPLGANYVYSLNGGAYQSGINFTGLTAGSFNIIAVKDISTGCISSNGFVSINNIPTPPSGIISQTTQQPNCITPTGSVDIFSPTGINLAYSSDGINYQSGTNFNGLVPGTTYHFTIKDTGTGCISPVSIININTLPANPATPVATATQQPSCNNPVGVITITAPAGVNYIYSDDGLNYQLGAVFSGLTPGTTYPITVKDNSTGCVSAVTQVSINGIPAVPSTPVVTITQQPNCNTPSGTITITSPIGAGYLYSNNGTTFQSSVVFTGLTPGANYPISVKDNISGCVSSVNSIGINTITPNPATPVASITQQPNCTTPTGTITISTPNGVNYLYSNDGITYQVSNIFNGLSPSTSYPITVKDNSTGCISAALPLTTGSIPANPAAPVALATQQPNCINPNGTITISSPIGVNYTYSDNNSVYQTGVVFYNLTPGTTYPLTVKDNSTGCISAVTNVPIHTMPSNPSSPVILVTQQPNCIIQTGAFSVTAPLGTNYFYNINGLSYQSGNQFSGLIPGGNYTVTVKDTSSGCISAASLIGINTIPANPTAPAVTITQQPTCTISTGTMNITAPTGIHYQYSTDGINYQSSTLFTGLAAGTAFLVTVKDTSTGCVSNFTQINIGIQPPTPGVPTLNINAPTCLVATGSIQIVNPVNGNSYSFDNGLSYQASATSPALVSGTYQVLIKNPAGCVSIPTPAVIDPQPATPAAPTFILTQPDCTTSTGLINVTSPLIGVTYSFDNGLNYQSSVVSGAMTPNTYHVVVKNSDGCISAASIAVINPQPVTPGAPTVRDTFYYCQGASATALTAIGTNLQWYTAATGGVGTNIAPIPSTTTTGNTSYYVSQQIGLCEGPRAEIVVSINTIPAPPTVTSPVTYCQYDAVTALTAIGNHLLWYSSPVGGVGDTLIKPTTLAAGNYNYFVSQTITGCESPRTPLQVVVNPTPFPGIDKTEIICYNGHVNLNSFYDTTGFLSWTNNSIGNISRPDSVTIADNYHLAVGNIFGCKDTVTLDLVILPPVQAIAGADTTAIIGQPTPLHAYGAGVGGTYLWSSVPTITNAIISDPTSANPLVTLYNLNNVFQLVATNLKGCTDTAYIQIKALQGPAYYVPTAFSPNADHINDLFYPIPVGIVSTDWFIVFNRYGEVVFQTNQWMHGWDGNFKGKPQPVGTYVWELQGRDQNGQIIFKKGSVVLIR